MAEHPFNPDNRLTRDAAAKALTEAGYPTSATTLATKVSRGGGPTYRLYSGRAIYLWSDLLAWAESRVTEPRCNSSEVLEGGDGFCRTRSPGRRGGL
jgi:hypothetical protein